MTEQTVYCEECLEDIPGNEVLWDDGRLYCKRCGSEMEQPDRDIFEEIIDNRSGLVFPAAKSEEEETGEEGGGEKEDAPPAKDEVENGEEKEDVN